MDFNANSPARARPRGTAVAAVAGWLALAAYALFLSLHVGAVAGASDSSGYWNHARLLDSGRVHVAERALPGLPPAGVPPFLYVPLGFRPVGSDGAMVATYPTGLALSFVALKTVAGWRQAGNLSMILHAVAGLVATFALCRATGLGRAWSALGTAIVGLSPLYVFMSLQAMSDIPSLAWTTAAVLAALRSRSHAGWALAAGAALAVDVLLRPTNVLAFVPVALALGFSPRRGWLLALGGLPGAVFLCLYNRAAYGSLLTTGYGDTSRDFLAAYVPGTLLHYALWLPVLFSPIALFLFRLPWAAEVPPRTRWLLAAWIVVYAAFYTCYRCTHETWWYLRFLLPAAPAMVAASLLGARSLALRLQPRLGVGATRAVAALVLGISALTLFAASRRLYPYGVGQDEIRYRNVAEWVEAHVPEGAACLCMQSSGALFYYTQHPILRWDFIDAPTTARLTGAIQRTGTPVYAVLFPFEIEAGHVFDRRLPGRWTQVADVNSVLIFRREPSPPGG